MVKIATTGIYLHNTSLKVRLLACCTMGKNVYTEIKCHSLLPLDDIVTMVCHKVIVQNFSIVYLPRLIPSSISLPPDEFSFKTYTKMQAVLARCYKFVNFVFYFASFRTQSPK